MGFHGPLRIAEAHMNGRRKRIGRFAFWIDQSWMVSADHLDIRLTTPTPSRTAPA